MQTKLLVDEIRRRGHACQVLKINENRQHKSRDYVDVQGGLDYLLKLLWFVTKGYRLHAHVNGESKKGYLLAASAMLLGRLVCRPGALSFHGGIPQTYFPASRSRAVRAAFRLLFLLPASIVCDSIEIKHAIATYGIDPHKIEAIPCFSPQSINFQTISLSPQIEGFLGSHEPVFFSYVSYRPEYHLEALRRAMSRFGKRYAKAGFIWLGFPAKELPRAQEYVSSWPVEESERLLLLGNLDHDQFLTLMSRCDAVIRTPECDGVSGSVLESLALGIPVLASENGRRPEGVLTFKPADEIDLAEKLEFLISHYEDVKTQAHFEPTENSLQKTADWLLGEPFFTDAEPVHAE